MLKVLPWNEHLFSLQLSAKRTLIASPLAVALKELFQLLSLEVSSFRQAQTVTLVNVRYNTSSHATQPVLGFLEAKLVQQCCPY